MCCQCRKYMNTWKHVGRGVVGIYKLRHMDKDILSVNFFHTQMQTIWINGTNEKSNCHPGKFKSAKSVEFVFGMIKQENENGRNIKKPQKIWNNKQFIKWNHIVKDAMNNVKSRIICGIVFL